MGFPIRKFPDQCLLAAPQDLSQPVTSFIASRCQGIHQMPFRRLIQLKTTRREQKTKASRTEVPMAKASLGKSAYDGSSSMPSSSSPAAFAKQAQAAETKRPLPNADRRPPDPCKVRQKARTRSVSEVLLERRMAMLAGPKKTGHPPKRAHNKIQPSPDPSSRLRRMSCRTPQGLRPLSSVTRPGTIPTR